MPSKSVAGAPAADDSARSTWLSGERCRAMLDALTAAIFATDAQGRIVYFNPACVEFAGRTPKLGTDQWCVSWKLLQADGSPLPHAQCALARALRERRVIRGDEAIAERPDGTRIWFEAHPAPIFDDAGELIGGVNMLVDITQRKQAEHASAFLVSIVQDSDDAIVGKDLDATITSWNQGAERLFGYTADEVVGRSVSILFPPERLDEETRILERLKRGERVDHFETVRVRKDGQRLDISLTISPIKDASGRIVGASKIARDITQRKRIEVELKQHRQNLQRLVDERSAELRRTYEAMRVNERMASVGTLAAGLAHDMSNLLLPLGTRLDMLLMEKRVPTDVHDQLVVIGALLDHLRNLSKNLSLFSRDPAKEGIVGNTDLRQWYAAVHKLLNASVGSPIEMRWNIPEGLPAVGIAPHRLTQVIQNLVHNARDAVLARTDRPEGSVIAIEARVVTGDDGDIWGVAMTVRDNGEGMDQETQQRCIEPFFTTRDRPREHGARGSGLGLSMAHQIAERSGGSLSIESQRGVGTTITLLLPAAER